jgi:transposase InsO family protein
MKVSRSGYYKWTKKRREYDKSAEYKEIVYSIFYNSKETYGSRRIKYSLLKQGIRINRKAVQRIMREMNLEARGRRKFKITTNSKHKKMISPNIIKGDFSIDRPNRLWVSDITYITTQEGWLYLNVILDCYDRRIVNWYTLNSLNSNLAVIPTEQALHRIKPTDLVFHTDKGVQYTSDEFKHLLKIYGVRQSMSGKGNCYDNAMAESFFHTLKSEIGKNKFNSRAEAELEIFKYIDMFYNPNRIHSSIDYFAPLEYYNAYFCK